MRQMPSIIKTSTRLFILSPALLSRLLLAVALLLAPAAQAQASPNWPLAPYSYYAENESLQDVLQNFAGSFSLALQLSPGVDGQVNGRFTTDSPTEFMNRLGGVYGFNWFVYAGNLFVSRSSEMSTQAINAMGNSISALREALQQLGVFDERFGWGELPDQGIALVTGPPAYVKLVEKTINALPLGAGAQEVVVFRLKHASVNDRTIRYRDQEVVTPGLATVLKNLILGSSSGVNNQVLSAIAAPLRSNPPNFSTTSGDSTGESPAPAASDGRSPGSTQRATGLRLQQPTVQADPRLNAIIVQDVPDRIPIYRELINQLDQASTLIEIEAMIVDVNSDLVNQLGVTWGAHSGRSGTASFGYGDLSLTPSGGLPLDYAAGLAPGTLGISVGSVLVARLHALETKGQAHILSQPSILTADNMGALIDLSDTFYIQTRGERVATVTPVTVGTSLRVTPRFIDSHESIKVELTVDIEDGRIVQEEQIDNLPTVRKSNISTLAVVNNDQTLLIGGYNSSLETEQVDKVPLLGDIPGLGALFSDKSRTVQRRERLFLIRPRVVAIDGKTISDPNSSLHTGYAINATWRSGSSRQQIGSGQYLELTESQNTRVRVSAPVTGNQTGNVVTNQ